MNNIRNRIELQFAAFARKIYHHRFKTLFLMLIAVGALLSQLPTIQIDTSTEAFLHKTDPALVAYNDFRDQFGRDEVVIVALKPQQVFDVNFLKTRKAFKSLFRDNVDEKRDFLYVNFSNEKKDIYLDKDFKVIDQNKYN